MTSTGSEEMLSQAGGMSKIERYKWSLLDEPGRLSMVSKHVLFVDDEYQRNANELKVKALAGEWSWVACGTLIVAERDSRLYVVDGQHRLLAARRRSDIKEVPCIIFSTNDVRQEAFGFLRANTNRKPITSVEKFKALIMTGDPHAILVNELISQAGRHPSNSTGANTVRCLSLLLSSAKNNKDVLIRIWPLATQLTEGQVLHEKLLSGLLFLEERMPAEESLNDTKWRRRLIDIGPEKLKEGAEKASAFYARGGARVWAAGIMELLNKGLRNKLVVRGLGAPNED